MKRFLAALFAFLCLSLPVQAGDRTFQVQVINFSAEWCPVCRVFDPRLDEVMESMPDPAIEWLTIDLTVTKDGSREQKNAFWQGFYTDMHVAGLERVHAAYNRYPYTGFAVVIAGDTKETLACLTGSQRASDIRDIIQTARSTVASRAPGHRRVSLASCPDAFL